MVFPNNALMCIKKVQLINHDCQLILALLNMMLYVMLAGLSNAVCLCNASFFFFFATDFC